MPVRKTAVGAKRGAVVSAKKPAPKRTATPRVTAKTAVATLLTIMNESDKDHVRVSAAKAVLARVTAEEERTMRKNKTKAAIAAPNPQQHKAALDAIARLLDELAAAKSVGVAGTAQLDEDSAPTAANARG